jgi:cell division protein ZapB
MSFLNLQDQLSDRIERLILRHEEVKRTNALLSQQVGQLTHERDQLKSRLETARNRIDALLDRLPEESTARTSNESN